MAHWLYPANIKYYDVLGAFAGPETFWPAHTTVAEGDTVYIYLATPYQQIAYVCTVASVNLPLEAVLDQIKPFLKEDVSADETEKPFMRLVKTGSVDLETGSLLCYGYLKEHGLAGTLMGPRKLENNPVLLDYITRLF